MRKAINAKSSHFFKLVFCLGIRPVTVPTRACDHIATALPLVIGNQCTSPHGNNDLFNGIRSFIDLIAINNFV